MDIRSGAAVHRRERRGDIAQQRRLPGFVVTIPEDGLSLLLHGFDRGRFEQFFRPITFRVREGG